MVASSARGVDLISCQSGTLGAESPAWATVWIQVLRPRSSLGPHAGFSLNRPEQLVELALELIRLGKRGELSTLSA